MGRMFAGTICAAGCALLGAGPGVAAGRPVGHVWSVSPAPLPGVPAGQQFRTIGAAAAQAQAGDTVLIHTGVYRESVTVDHSGTADRPIRFESAPASNVMVTGADLLKGWQREPGPDSIYSVAWPYHFLDWSPVHAHPDDDYHLLIGRVEQVFASGYALRQVLKRDQLSRGSFFVDLDGKRLYVWRANNAPVAPDDSTVQASNRSVLWHCTGSYVTVRGIRFRYAANSAQQGAAEFTGRGDAAEDCIFERTNGEGVSMSAPDLVMRRCTFQDNGQMGFGGARVDHLLVTGCTIRNNNTKGFDRGWEAGGEKIVLTRGAVIDGCRVLDNRGVGLWFDIGNENCEVRNCLVAGNEDAGIFYEISYGLHAHDNVIVGNGLADSPGAWGAAAGICLSSSPGCLVERNLLIANKEGFNFREQGRTTPRIGAKPGAKEVWIWNHDEVIRHNVIADNRDAQTWGWFDVWDERLWPAAMQVNHRHERPSYVPAADFARNYQAEIEKGAPVGLDLEKLHISFSHNLYDAPDGEGLFHWGTAWLRHRYYDSLAAVRQELGLEQGSVVAPFRFGDYLTLDFRTPADSPAIRMDCLPHGAVPDVRLGVLPPASSKR